MEAEGWYRDPFDRHIDRWFSVGHPTSLVRDDRVESRDEPPSGASIEPVLDAALQKSAVDDAIDDTVDREGAPYDVDTSVGAVMDYVRLHPTAYPA